MEEETRTEESGDRRSDAAAAQQMVNCETVPRKTAAAAFFSRHLNVTKQMFVVCFSPEYKINSVNSSVERAGEQRATEVDKGQAKHRSSVAPKTGEKPEQDDNLQQQL